MKTSAYGRVEKMGLYNSDGDDDDICPCSVELNHIIFSQEFCFVSVISTFLLYIFVINPVSGNPFVYIQWCF
jgi:hypothetical protein